MTSLTFDPDRLRLLSRALEELWRRLDFLGNVPAPEDLSALVRSAQESARHPCLLVRTSLAEIESGRLVRTCSNIADLVERYREWGRSTKNWWTSATTQVTTTSDDILRDLECGIDPQRAGELIDALDDVQLMILGSADLALVERVWAAATDPATTPPALAGSRIRRLLDVVFDDRPWERGLATGSIDPVTRARRERELKVLCARLVAPWQLEFTRPDSPWSWSMSNGAHRLHQISEIESAADALLEGLSGAVLRTLTDLPNDSSDRLRRIDAVAQAVGTSLEVRRMSEETRARSASEFDALRTLVGALSMDGPWPISLLVDAGADWLGGYLDTSDEQVRRATLESLAQRQILATVAVVAVWSSAVTRSRSTSRKKTSTHALAENELVGHVKITEELEAELRHTYQSFDNAAGRGLSLAQLTSTKSG